MTDAIKPPNVASIWISNNILFLELPSAEGKLSHTLRLPCNQWGLSQAVEILKARKEDSLLGMKGDQTQFQADEEIRQLMKRIDPNKVKRPKQKFSAELQDAAKDILRRMKMI